MTKSVGLSIRTLIDSKVQLVCAGYENAVFRLVNFFRGSLNSATSLNACLLNLYAGQLNFFKFVWWWWISHFKLNLQLRWCVNVWNCFMFSAIKVMFNWDLPFVRDLRMSVEVVKYTRLIPNLKAAFKMFWVYTLVRFKIHLF